MVKNKLGMKDAIGNFFLKKSLSKIVFSMILALSLAAALSLASDIVAKPGDLYVDGDVGIGTSIPTEELSISSSAAVSNSLLYLDNSYGTSSDLVESCMIMGGRAQQRDWARLCGKQTSSGTYAKGDMYFYTYSSNAAHTVAGMVLSHDSNLGINDTTPDLRLEVVGESADGYFGVSSIAANDGDLFIVDESGNVGIGESNPTGAKLFINRTAGKYGIKIDSAVQSDIALRDGNSGVNAKVTQIVGDASRFYIRGINDAESAVTYNLFVADLSNGKVGINDSTPSTTLDIAGDVRADDFIEYSPIYVGDALSKVGSIGYIDGSEDGDWAEVDHSTLPEGMKVTVKEIWFRNKKTGEETDDAPSEEYMDDYEEFIKLVDGRNLGAQAQFNLKAIKELKEENDLLKSELCLKDNSYSWC